MAARSLAMFLWPMAASGFNVMLPTRVCSLQSTPTLAGTIPASTPAFVVPRVARVALTESGVCDDVEADADAVFSVIDVDGDGSITRTELVLHLHKAGYSEDACNMLFEKLDTNQDEEISREELRAGFLKYTPLRSAPGLGAYNAGFIAEIHADADALFAAIDADGDGTVSKDELRDHLKQFSKYSFKAISNIFKMLDVNKDGDIERGELRNAFVKYSALRQAIGEGPNFK